VHLLAGAMKKDYGAGTKMVQKRAARRVQNGSSPVYEPDAPPSRGTDARTGGPALGPADHSLLSSACCGTDAGAATAAM
jgi:hypothetical protein